MDYVMQNTRYAILDVDGIMKKEDGITLIELIIVISVLAILVVALGFSFQGWMGRYRVENEIKQMYIDLMNVRARAMMRNRMHFVDFPVATASTTQYRIREDTNEDNSSTVVGGDTILPTFPKTVQYAMTRDGGTISSEIISFDTRGIIQPINLLGTTLCISTTVNPDYDCIGILPTRINMGKLITSIPDGGACNAANCVAK
jgi:prepilin-type N-terminal cleavage/methylation domain-containing protein